jgi:hypothetical protein
MHTCKFCGYAWEQDSPCYNNEEPCGHQECPACFSCQGRTDVTPPMVAAAKFRRELTHGSK